MTRATKEKIRLHAAIETDAIFSRIAELLVALESCNKTSNQMVVDHCEIVFAILMLGHDVQSPLGRCWCLDDLDLCDAVRQVACRNIGRKYLTADELRKKFKGSPPGVQSPPSEE
jgi:hypothetical protein